MLFCSFVANELALVLSVMDNDEQQSTWNWESVGVAAFGIMLIAAGVYWEACTTSALAVVGIWLSRQGSYDIAFAVRTGLTIFSWNEYFNEKLLSIPFTVISVGVESWLYGVSENAFTVSKVARKVRMVSARGVTVVCFGKALQKAKDAMLEKFHWHFEAEIDKMFAHEFADLREHIEDLHRLDPSNAGQLISGVFDDVVSKVNDDGNILDRFVTAAVEYLIPTTVELGLQIVSKTSERDIGDRTMDFVIFTTVVAMSVTESRFFARNFMKLLQETISHRHQTLERPRSSQQADPEAIEEFTARFRRRVKSFMARRISEICRRGLVQATAQSFIPSGIAYVADVAGY